MDIQIHTYAKESKTLNEFVRKLGYKCYGSTIKNLIQEHNVDVKHLNISHKYIDQFTDEEFTAIINKSKFWKDAMYECGYNSYKGVPQIKERAQHLGLNTNHILGEDWAKHKYSGNPKYTLEQICVENSFYTDCQLLLKRLKRELGWHHKCTSCEQSTWTIKEKTYPIPLELEHINGNHFDHRLENLTFLCPNCHAFTATYKGRNLNNRGKKGQIPEDIAQESGKKENISEDIIRVIDATTTDGNTFNVDLDVVASTTLDIINKQSEDKNSKQKQINTCLDCECKIDNDNLRCFQCNKKNMRLVERPPYEQLMKEIEETSYVAVGKKYGVSDNAIRKWVKTYRNEPTSIHTPKTKKCPECKTLICNRSTLCRVCSINKMKKDKPLNNNCSNDGIVVGATTSEDKLIGFEAYNNRTETELRQQPC